MKNEVILKLQRAGYWTIKDWAVDNEFDPRVVSVIIGRWWGKKTDSIPRGNSAQIIKKLKETFDKIPSEKPVKSIDKIPIQTDWLNTKEAAVYLRVKEKTLRNWVSRGVIPLVKEPSTGTLRFNKKALDSWLLRGER
jgi:excisionase family DNA binding protein